jgi:ribosomal protein L18E
MKVSAPLAHSTTAYPFKWCLALAVAMASQGAWSAQCPTKPSCTFTESNFNGNLNNGQNLCINSGTFTGNLNSLPSNSTVYVAAGATFSPSNLNNPAGKIINCGTTNFGSLVLSNGFRFTNHNLVNFNANINWNGTGDFYNDLGAKMNLNVGLSLKSNSVFVNDGDVMSKGVFESESGTTITNNAFIRLTGGNFNPNGKVTNSGIVETDEFININTASELVNNCSFIAKRGFNNNSDKTRNFGYIFVTGTAPGDDLIQNNKAFFQGPNGLVKGTRFFNSAAITGKGRFYFTGDTRNQGPFGNDGGGINFFDTTKTTGKIFDVQSPTPHSSVTGNSFTPPGVSDVVPSCSPQVTPNKPAITINVIAGDDVINTQEDNTNVAITGTSSNAPNGSQVTVTLNGKTYMGTVSNNTWSVTVPAADAQALDANEVVSAKVSLAGGGGSSDTVTRDIQHRLQAPSLNITPVTGDDIINTQEDNAPVTLSGTTSQVENGQKVTLSLNGKTYEATVNNNSWSLAISAADAQALDALETLSGTVTNQSGDSAQATRNITHALVAPSISINPVTGDDIINAQEDKSPVALSGTTNQVENGQKVALSLNGKSYEATVNNNSWSVAIPAADAQALDAQETLSATVTNRAGDSASGNRNLAHIKTLPSVTINPVTGDDIINSSEDDAPVLITGTTTLAENGSTLVLSLNGKLYNAAVNNGTWQISLPALDAQALDASEVVSAQVTNAAGNTSAPATRTISHTTSKPTITINPIAGDDVINSTEDDSPVLVSGKTTGVEDGQKVSIVINGKTYEAVVTGNTWSTPVPAADVQAFDPSEKVTATVTDKAGNTSAPAEKTVARDADKPTITINPIAGDDVINSTEDDSPVLVSGKTTGVEDGQKVSIVINGKTYEAVVAGNSWQVSVPAADVQAFDPSEKVTATVTDKAGNTSVPAEKTVARAGDKPTVSINPIAGDDVINSTEDDSPVLVSGKTTGVEDGQKVSIVINGKTYEAVVTGNTWSTPVPAADVQAFDPSEKVTATVTDKAGNTSTPAEKTVARDADKPTITINPIAGDDVINSTEDDSPVLVSGKTTGVEDGQKVSIVINGKTYEAVVTGNTWSTPVPAADVQAFDPSEKVTATVTDKAGNNSTPAEKTVARDADKPTITINPIAGDDVINSTEDDSPVLVSGKTTGVEDGQKVSIVINGKTYEAVVTGNTWSTPVPAADVQAFDPSEKVTATVTDKAGNTSVPAEKTVARAGDKPTVSINPIAGDDIINSTEDDSPVLVSGKTTGVEDGQKVSIVINGKTYEAVVSGNSWQVPVPAADVQAFDPSEKVTATVTDKAGNTSTPAEKTVARAGDKPTVSINPIAGDDVINSTEDDSPVLVSGKTTGVEDGQKVSIVINGKTYEAVVTGNTWSTSVPAADVQAFDPSEKVTATVTDKAGNTSAPAEKTVARDADKPTITINPIAGDDVINSTEDDSPVLVSGKTTGVEDGQKVSIVINGKTYEAVVTGNSWQVPVPAADVQAFDSSEKVTATVTDKAGNTSTPAEKTVARAGDKPTVSINPIAGDDVINSTEDDSPVLVSGKTTGVEDGQKVSIVINGKTYEAVVTGNTWSTSVPAADVQAFDPSEKVTATVTDKAGNTSAPAEKTVARDADKPTITINPIAGDDVINSTEDDAPVLVSGKTTGVEDGQKVTLVINGKTYEAVVTNNSWQVPVPAADVQAFDPSEKVTATVTDKAGNTSDPAEKTLIHSGDKPVITLNTVAGDDVINGTEDDAPVVLSGKTALVEDGQTVTLNLNGKTYTATVKDNAWSTSLPTADAQQLGASEKLVATVSDKAGNAATPAEKTVSRDADKPTITINPIAGDDVINSTEDDSPVLVSGKTTGVEDGQKVSVVINGKTYEATVTGNSWQVPVPAADVQAFDPSENVTATVTDKAGNTSAPAEKTVARDADKPTITINPIAGDDVINSTEDDAPVLISGKTTGVEDGQKVSIVINGKTYEAVVTGNTWSTPVPGADVQAFDPSEKVTATVTDKAGNTSDPAEKTLIHSGDKPVITLNTVAGDDVINGTEDDAPVVLSGKTAQVEDGQTVTLNLNGKTYTATVKDNAWSTSLPAADAQQLGASEKLVATVSDKAGNAATPAEKTVARDADKPTITINPIAGDDVINSTEDDAPVLISGKTTGVEDGQKVSIVINGKTYEAVVTGNTWSTPVPAADVQAFDPSEKVTATVTDKAGNTSDPAEKTLIHSGDKPVITLNTVAGDDVINGTEDDAPVVLSGKTAQVEDGQTVTLNLNGKTYTATVKDNAWTTSLPAADAQQLGASEKLVATVSDKAGNAATPAEKTVARDADKPTITINPIAGDDVINSTEDDAPVVVSGKTTGVEDGQKVTLVINGKTYEAVVTNNNWQVEVPASDVQTFDPSEKVTATVTDKAGNTSDPADKTLSYATDKPSITLSPVTGDNSIDSIEDNGPVAVEGTTRGIEDGTKVTFTLNDKDYEALVTAGRWTLTLPAADVAALDDSEQAVAKVTDAKGQEARTQQTITHVGQGDWDGDGIPDDVETTKDSDGDKVPDYKDLDSDNDGLPDEDEIKNTTLDTNKNGIPDVFDAAITGGKDDDKDGIDDSVDAQINGTPKGTDNDKDGILDNAVLIDSDKDGLADYVDLDSDNDAVPDLYELNGGMLDKNGDARADGADSDGDGLLDVFDPSQGNNPLVAKDVDKDGIKDPLDLDADNDGLPDISEDALGISDPDGDGRIGTAPFVDTDKDGLGDEADINNGGKLGSRIDSDFNGTSDGQSTDRDGDGISDLEESLGKTRAQTLDPDGDGQIGTTGGNQKPQDGNGNGLPDAAETNLGKEASTDSNGNGVPDGIELQLTQRLIPVPSSNAQNADFDRDGYPDWIEVRFGGDPLDNAEADKDQDGVPDWVENTDILLDNQNDTDADGFTDLLEQVQGTGVNQKDSPEALFDASLAQLLNPSRYEGRSLKPVIWLDLQQNNSRQAQLGQTAGAAQLTARIGNYHVFGDPRDPATTPQYDWSGSDKALLGAATVDGNHLTLDTRGLAAGHYTVSLSVTLAGHTSSLQQQLWVGEQPLADADGDFVPDSQDTQDARQGLLQALPAQGSQLIQAMAPVVVKGVEQADKALRLRAGPAANGLKLAQAGLTPAQFSQYGQSIGNTRYADPIVASGRSATQVYSLEAINLPHVGASAEVVIPLNQAVGTQAQVRVFNPLSGWQDFALGSGDELASAPWAQGQVGSCPAPGDNAYQPGLTTGHNCLLVRVQDGGVNDSDNNDSSTEDGQGDVNGLVALNLALASTTDTNGPSKPGDPVTGSIQTGLKGGGSLGIWFTLLLAPLALLSLRRKKHAKSQ